MYRTTLNLLAGAIALGLTAGAAGAAETADAGKDSTTLGTVLVTGSNIKRSDTAGPNPVQIVTRDKKASTSYIQRRLQIGYNRAASLMERMENEGIVGQANHAGKREILVGQEEHAKY